MLEYAIPTVNDKTYRNASRDGHLFHVTKSDECLEYSTSMDSGLLIYFILQLYGT